MQLDDILRNPKIKSWSHDGSTLTLHLQVKRDSLKTRAVSIPWAGGKDEPVDTSFEI